MPVAGLCAVPPSGSQWRLHQRRRPRSSQPSTSADAVFLSKRASTHMLRAQQTIILEKYCSRFAQGLAGERLAHSVAQTFGRRDIDGEGFRRVATPAHVPPATEM